MNLVQVQNRLRGLSDPQLQQIYAMNSGEVPPFLVLAESKRRQEMRDAAVGQQNAAQASQPSVAERIMTPAQQPVPQQPVPAQGAAPAQGAPMGQAGMPQMQGPAQGGIRSFASGGLIPYEPYYGPERGREGGGIAALFAQLKDAFTGGKSDDEEEEERKRTQQADVPRKTAADYPAVPNEGIASLRPVPRRAAPEAPQAPVPMRAPASPAGGLAALAAPPETLVPSKQSPLVALRDAAQAAQAGRPRLSDLYEEVLKTAPTPGANVRAALEQQQGTLDQRLKQAEAQRLQNFFLQLAGGQSQNALTNIGGALQAEAAGFQKVSADVAKQRDELVAKLAEAKDAGDEKTYARNLKKLDVLALDNADEAALRKELASLEASIASTNNAAERLELDKRKEKVAERLKAAETKFYEARAATAGTGRAVDPVATAKRVADTAKVGYDKLPPTLRIQLDAKGGNAAVERVMLAAAQQGVPISYDAALKQVMGGAGGEGKPKFSREGFSVGAPR